MFNKFKTSHCKGKVYKVMSRFNVQREQLSGYIQNAIMCIEFGTNLKIAKRFNLTEWLHQKILNMNVVMFIDYVKEIKH